MMSDLGQHGESFLRIVESLEILYASIDIRALAVKDGATWSNLVTVVTLRSEAPSKLERIPRIQTQHVGIWQSVRPATELDMILGKIASGRLRFGRRTVHYARSAGNDGTASQPYQFWEPWFHGVEKRHWRGERRWGIHKLLARGEKGHDLLQRGAVRERDLDASLKALDPPYDGLRGAAIGLVGASESFLDDAAYVHFIAPLEAKLDPEACRFEVGRLHFKVISGSHLAARHCSLTWTAQQANRQVAAERVDGERASWETHPEGLVWRGVLDLPPADGATLYLRLAGTPVMEQDVRNYGADGLRLGVRLYKTVDRDLGYMKEGLTSPRNDEKLEATVGRLFSILGFEVLPLVCDKRLSDAVDVLAVDRVEGYLLAIECTLKSLDTQGKLGKLKVRVHELAGVLPTLKVRGVAVSAATRDALLQGDVEKAGEGSIAVLSQEDLLGLLDLALESQPTSVVLDHIRARVASESIGVLGW